MTKTKEQIAEKLKPIFQNNEKIHSIFFHKDGFVANAYKFRAPGTRLIFCRDGKILTESYDRKRSYASGSLFSAKTKNGGTFKNICFDNIL